MTPLARHMRDTIDLLEALAHRYPRWSIWCDRRPQWTATRASRGTEQPSTGSNLVWVYAQRHDELMTQMEGHDR